MSNVLTCSGCSCCTQCPAPSTRWKPTIRVHALFPHVVHGAGSLIDAPVAPASDEHRWHVDGTARERPHLGDALGIRPAPYTIALKGAGELGPGVLARVHLDLGLGQPLAARDLGRRRHHGRNRLRHAFVTFHDVIGGDLGHLLRGPRTERPGFVPFPIGTLVMVVGAEEGMETLRGMEHLVVGPACALIVLVILPRRVELRELPVELVIGRRGPRRGRAIGGVERQ